MYQTQEETRSAARRRAGRRAWHGRRALASLLMAGIGLLSLQAVWAQGNPAAVIQQMQAQLASLTQTVQRLNTQLTNERQLRTKQQQQMAATTRHLQQLHAAVGAAARAGDPTGTAIRS